MFNRFILTSDIMNDLIIDEDHKNFLGTIQDFAIAIVEMKIR